MFLVESKSLSVPKPAIKDDNQCSVFLIFFTGNVALL